MKFTAGKLWTDVDSDFLELSIINRFLNTVDDNDKPVELINENRFYTGLLDRVLNYVKAQGLDYQVDWLFTPDRRDPAKVMSELPPDILPGIELYPYQISAATKVICGGGRGLVDASAGAGKSE